MLIKILVVIISIFLVFPSNAKTTLPADVMNTCDLNEDELKKWFKDKQIEQNGLVMPANSVEFDDDTNCNFYKWGGQMFLWLTSAVDDRIIFDSKNFFDVSSSADGIREFMSNTGANTNNYVLGHEKPEHVDSVAQAGRAGVLMAQAERYATGKGSLVYYGIHTNNVFAYFLSGQKEKVINATTFPTTKSELEDINLFAGSPLADEIALTLEIKTAWVDVDTLFYSDKYIQIEANVPNYQPLSKRYLSIDPERPTVSKRLALVGMHIVGSVKDHPEMVWATFEHINNAPFDTYYYKNTAGDTKTVPFNSQGKWLFMEENGTKDTANNMAMKLNQDNLIEGYKGQSIGPSNTYIVNPWGSKGNDKSNDVIKNNTDIISLNSNILKLLSDGDIRKNYIQIGSVWTQKGDIPPQGTQKGSVNLANSTMETYTQSSNCFSCHQGESFEPNGLSHIYSELQPLKLNK